MAENTATPLWLDIKTEYIDENFEKVLQYLYQGAKRPASRDSFYVTTVRLLEKRIQELITQTVSAACGYDLTNHHHALADAEACAWIAREIL